MRRRRVARDDDGLHALLEQKGGDLVTIPSYGLRRFGTIRHACRVAEVDETLTGKLLHDGVRNGESSESRIEHSDGRVAIESPAHQRIRAATTVPACVCEMLICEGRSHRCAAT